MKKEPYKNTNYDFPLYTSFPEFLTDIGRKYAERPALSWFTRKQEKMTYTYSELLDRVEKLRTSLFALAPSGARIAIAAENSAEWIITFLAAASGGYTTACIDVEQSDESIRSMITDVRPELLFVSSQLLEICAPLLEDGSIGRIIEFDGGTPDAENWTGLSEASMPLPAASAGSAGIAELVFTSGTTGTPKIVMLEGSAILQNMHDASCNVCLYDTVYTALPFYHTYGLNSAVLCPFLQGAHLYINGDIRTSLRDLWLAKPDTVFAVPLSIEVMRTQVRQKLNEADARFLRKLRTGSPLKRALLKLFCRRRMAAMRRNTVGSMKLIISGGASLDPELAAECELLGVQVLQGYGITECSPLIAVNCNYASKSGTVGLPLKSTKIRLIDGEIQVSGPSVMKGYYNAPELTAEAFEDGWFKTGDLGYFDKDGFLTLTGRKKNLIVFKNGNKVSPEKLEAFIRKIPLVKEVLVYGSVNGASADDVKITASIFPDPEQAAGMESYELLGRLQNEIEKINETLPSFQQIQMVTLREKELPKTAMQKLKR